MPRSAIFRLGLLASIFVLTAARGEDSKPAEKSGDKPAAEAKPAEIPGEKPAEKPPEKLAGHSFHAEVFNEGPRQKANLMAGMPRIHFPVTSKSSEAQQFFLQGLGQVHGFWYNEAERSFRQAAALDKDCGMAYWGMALANLENLDRAKKFMDQCGQHKQGLSERELMYIDALDAYVKADRGKTKERAEAYTKALEKLLYKFPSDVEARSLLALQLWKNRDASLPITSFLAVDAVLDQVFREEPMHPAHHYRIHLWDHERAENAIASSALCGQTSPGIAHMWHMPGHIYSGLRRYDDACWQQEASARVDHAQMIRDRLLPDQIHNYAHNNEWLVRDLVYVGRLRDALDLAKNMCELPRHPKYNTLSKGSANFGPKRLQDALLTYQMWDELAALLDTPYLPLPEDEADQVKHWRMVGTVRFHRGEVDQGNAALAELQKRLADQKTAQDKAGGEAEEKAKQEKKPDADIAKAKDEGRKKFDGKITDLQKGIDEIAGRQAVGAGKFKDGLELLKKAGGVDAAQLALIQSQAGEADPAIHTARAHAVANPKEVVPQAVLVDVLWRAGKRDEAKVEFQKLRDFSGSIDSLAIETRVLKPLSPIAQELGFGGDWRVVKPPAVDVGVRPSLDSLGPFRWQPSPAPDWTLKDNVGGDHSLSGFRGRPVVVMFFLGHGCLHCAQQLQAFAKAKAEFDAAGLALIAISSDDAAGLKQSVDNYKDGPLSIPLVADNSLATFKAYRCHDDFEQQPLHGVFLIDAAGLVRWQDISFEPFMDVKFLIGEAKRLLTPSAATAPPPDAKPNAADGLPNAPPAAKVQ